MSDTQADGSPVKYICPVEKECDETLKTGCGHAKAHKHTGRTCNWGGTYCKTCVAKEVNDDE